MIIRTNHHSRGAVLLNIWSIIYKVKKEDIATEIGCYPSQISRWIMGKKKPEMLTRRIIQKLTKGFVLAEDWDKENGKAEFKVTFIESA